MLAAADVVIWTLVLLKPIAGAPVPTCIELLRCEDDGGVISGGTEEVHKETRLVITGWFLEKSVR